MKLPENPRVLLPFHRSEVWSVKEAAMQAGRQPRTINNWVNRYGIGRRVAGRILISKVAFTMLVENDIQALEQYLSGDRSSVRVLEYFHRLRVAVPPETKT